MWILRLAEDLLETASLIFSVKQWKNVVYCSRDWHFYKNCSRRHFNFLILSFKETKAWFFMWILRLAEDLLEAASLIFSVKQWKNVVYCSRDWHFYKNCSRQHFNFLILSFKETKAWFFMWILRLAEDLLETASLIFSVKQWKNVVYCSRDWHFYKNCSRRHFNFLILSFKETKAWFFMWILRPAEDLLETASLIFSVKWMSTAAVVIGASRV